MLQNCDRVSRVLTLFITLLIAGSSGCALRTGIPARVGLELIAEGFTSPVALVAPEDGSRGLYVVDQVGVIWIISEGRRIEKPFLDLRARLVELNSFYDERGLLGLAFHPDFAANGRFYVSYSAPLRNGLSPGEWDHTTYISEFTISANDPNRADPASERVILAMDKPGYNYEAGHIAFGPDGYLYIATGDSVRDPGIEAGKFGQDISSLLGKILRIDVGGTGGTRQNYLIPADNPFVAGEGRPEIFAYGFRNPYRFSFDVSEQQSRLFVADVGQARMEEVNLIEPGGNYGWPVREGTTCFNPQAWDRPLESCSTYGLSEPVIAYAHKDDLSAIIGGIIYRGKALSDLHGGYVFGDWGRGNGRLFVAFPPGLGAGLWKITEIQANMPGNESSIGQLLGIGQNGDGEIYLLAKEPGLGPTGDSGLVYKIVPANE